MDPTAEFIKQHLDELGWTDLEIKTAKRYIFIGNLDKKTITTIAENLLFNPLIQEIALNTETINQMKPSSLPTWKLQYIDMLNMSDAELLELSQSRLLALSLPEMKVIQKYYQKLNRNPTDIELETFAQTWSEHCKHKTFKADIICNDDKKQYRIKSLFDTYIKKVTRELNKSWCLSVFEDNAGIIEFDKKFGIAFKVETHNHPSALEPYGGAATGIGGVIRDCLGCGLGAKPICNTDVFCFPPLNFPKQQLPKGVLHPKRIIEGVTLGVRDYGNRLGIPTANGAINFHSGFICNPYVYCGTVGIIPKTKIKKKIRAGDLIVLIGGKTGRDGIHGVTFASLELAKDTKQISSQAVQIGNPIEEKKVLDLMLQARDLNLYNATTDCGGGGLSSAIGELAKTGAVVNLEKVPLKYAGLSYTEIWISESQERMVLFVPRQKIKKLLKLAKIHNVDATVIGKVTDTKKLQLKYYNQVVGDIDLNFLHNGLPKLTLNAKILTNDKWKIVNCHMSKAIKQKTPDYNQKILQLISNHNVASKEWVVRQYDFEVQGKTVIKPFSGIEKVTPSDGCVLQPLPESKKGIVITCGIAVEYHRSPYWMSASAIDEAIRNAVALGADPNKIALLDNFCWASPEDAKTLGDLVLACQACYDFAKQFQTPFISGKDSLYNEYQGPDGKKIIPPSALLISAISVIDNIDQTVTADFKAINELIYIVGKTLPEFDVPKVFPK
ncbi:MAG: AIR synthase-related protein, partial [candidate division WOR-3 bacterium]